MAKVIKYTFNGMGVEIGWNETNEEIAKREADNGEYSIVDDGKQEVITETTDDVLNALLGVTV